MNNLFLGSSAVFVNNSLGSQLKSNGAGKSDDDHGNNSFGHSITSSLSQFSSGLYGSGGGYSSTAKSSYMNPVHNSSTTPTGVVSQTTNIGNLLLVTQQTSVQTQSFVNNTQNQSSFTTISLDAQKSDFGGKMMSFSKNGISISVEDPDHTGGKTPGTMTWIDTGKGAAGFGVIGNGNKQADTGAETVNVELDDAADSITISLVDHGSKNSDDSITFKIFQESGDITEVTLTLDSDAPDKVTDFTFDASDYGDGSQITEVEFYSSSNLGGGHGEASFLIGGIETTIGTATPPPPPPPPPTTDDPVFIVGHNVDDVEGSQVSFIVSDGVIGDDFGVIQGGNGDDILVGDVGGAYTVASPQVDLNVVLMLDISGSMYSTMADGRTRLDHLTDAVENLLADFNAYDNGDIMVHLVPFDTTAWGMQTYTVTDDADYAQAISHLDSLTPGGVTNYESALKAGIDWLQSGEPINGAITTAYFVSDGYPNYAIDDDTGSWTYSYYSGLTAMEEIQGLDGSNEIAELQALTDEVIGVGINIGSSISNLDLIDSDGSALNVISSDQLSQAFADSNPLNKLDPIGDDVINGGAGNDIIFGDALYTDNLAIAHNLGTEAGLGWEVFAMLESGASAINPDWTRADTLSYLFNNREEMMLESIDQEGEVRVIGNDIIDGGDGNDIIFGQEGDDIISGGEGGLDVIYGGGGADVFLFNSIQDSLDIVRDFSIEEGDAVDFSSLLSGFDPLQDAINDFVFLNEIIGNTILSVDVTGSGDISKAVDMVIIENITNIDLSQWVADGTLIV
ncbi:MAG: VWA domain-containing protein [Alphaproteobacteria bacterium]|nr:VWA domain-containing protein [Alphaproteobacteria bacterium]